MLAGFVEIREEGERSDRVVIRVHRFEGRRNAEAPDRVRVAVRKGTAPAVGSLNIWRLNIKEKLQIDYKSEWDMEIEAMIIPVVTLTS